MHFLIDFIPIAVFFIIYKWFGIYMATAVAIGLSFLQVLWKRIRLKRFEPVSLATFAVIALLGGATLLFKNPAFVKWKPTVVYWAMGLAFLITPWFHHETLIQKMFRQAVQLLPKHWAFLNYLWVVFFALMGVLNLYVAHNHSTDTWVNFKLFGTLGLTLFFLICQGFFMAKVSLSSTGNTTDGSYQSKPGPCPRKD